MKPVQLILENIGPFTGKTTIDFESLGEMFLISGKTGSGKTTIFDSMTFALYNKLPGNRNGIKTWRMRSDFCTSDANASVTFDFLLGRTKYRVVRNVPIAYTAKNGEIKTKGDAVAIFKLTDDGTWSEICNGLKSVDVEVKKLIGLEADEFSCIVLLPQGKFAEFLHQGSTKRAEILKKMFPVQLYSDIKAEAKEIASTFYANLKAVENEINRLKETCNPDTFDQDGKNLDNEVSDLETKRNKLQSSLEESKLKKQQLFNQLNDAKNYESVKLSYNNLLASEEDALNKKNKLDKAKQAQKATPSISEKNQAITRLESAKIEFSNYQQLLADNKEQQNKLALQENEITQLATRNSEISLTIHELNNAQDTLSHLNTAHNSVLSTITNQESEKTNLTEKEKVLSNLNNDIALLTSNSENSTALASTAADLHEKLTKAEQLVIQAQDKENLAEKIEHQLFIVKEEEKESKNLSKSLSDAEQILFEYKEEDKQLEDSLKSYHLSLLLKDDEPCPVCGSLTHPTPAHSVTSTVSNTDRISSQETLIDTARKALAETNERLSRHQGELTIYQDQFALMSSVPSFKEAQEAAQALQLAYDKTRNEAEAAQKNDNRKKEAEKQKAQLESEINPLRERISQLTAEVSGVKARYTELKRQMAETLQTSGLIDNSSSDIAILQSADFDSSLNIPALSQYLTDKLKSLSSELALNKEKETSYNKTKEILNSEGTTLTAKISEATKHINSLENDLKQSETRCLESIKNAGFNDELEVKQATLDDYTINSMQAELEKRESDKQRLCAQLEQAKSRVTDNVETLNTKLTELEVIINTSQKALEEATDLYESAIRKQEQFRSQKEAYLKAEASRCELSEQAADYCNLADDLQGKGGNTRKIPFDTWILGAYLKEVSVYASRRLQQMSDGRYLLLFSQEKSKEERDSGQNGLELSVLDTFTGKSRSCDSLSGGETFMASLSLALALTDVVQNRSGGIQLESLFIDEGFGSLDEETLDKALDLLDAIRGSRVVGLISHVDSIKGRIPARLEVERTVAGSTVHEIIRQDAE